MNCSPVNADARIHLPSSASGRNDVPTVIPIGVMAAVLASVAHEALGHALLCLPDGGRITLLPSV